MLVLTLEPVEMFDSAANRIYTVPERKIKLEHSLVSLSKWEARFKKSFLQDTERTKNETLWYFKCMALEDYEDEVWRHVASTKHSWRKIIEYIGDEQSATTFREDSTQSRRPQKEIITSELIYYWMVAQDIPLAAENWHLNRLITLIRVTSIKNEEASGKTKKIPKSQTRKDYAALNAKRRAEMNSKG